MAANTVAINPAIRCVTEIALTLTHAEHAVSAQEAIAIAEMHGVRFVDAHDGLECGADHMRLREAIRDAQDVPRTTAHTVLEALDEAQLEIDVL